MPIDALTDQAKIDSRWLEGVWIGVDIETDEVMIGTRKESSRRGQSAGSPKTQDGTKCKSMS